MIITWTYGAVSQDVQQAYGPISNWSSVEIVIVPVVGFVRAGQIANPGIRRTNGTNIGQVASVGIRSTRDGANGQVSSPGTRTGQIAQ